jgi:hypothetical protein
MVSPSGSFVVAALSEAQNIPHVFARIPPNVHEAIFVGGHSEDDTAECLERAGLRILDGNWRSEICELDIVALDQRVPVVCEVKTRPGVWRGRLSRPSVTVSPSGCSSRRLYGWPPRGCGSPRSGSTLPAWPAAGRRTSLWSTCGGWAGWQSPGPTSPWPGRWATRSMSVDPIGENR